MITSSPKESIAIIGMSCRFPSASSLDEFWELLKGGKDTITEIPRDRWNVDHYYDSDSSVENKTNQRHASLLKGIHDFDPLFFNISPAEASEMSPSQKLMLELAWEAIESSTVPFRKVKGSNVGVYVGNIWADYEHYRRAKNARTTSHSAVGMSSNVVANRVSFSMGFTGPSLVTDTGCSASLVALHLACQSLLSNETEMSLVGGINHLLDPDKYVHLTQFGGLSGKGKCSPFDSEADGFVRGEGGGVLLLKRLSDAERDGDKIFAIIRGTAVNNNGFNESLPATSTQGQKTLLEKVYREAGIVPGEVHFIEAHGTGTKLGDPNEAIALGEFFREGRNGSRLRVGSVKTNIGHTEATAGIAGLIKVVLAMQHRVLPPNLNFKKPNANIPFDELKLEVQTVLSKWPVHNGETFKAGVNSFGWGGTNAHAVVEEYRTKEKTVSDVAGTRYFLPLSAKSSAALKAYASVYAQQLEASDDATALDICVATALCKPEFDHRHLFTGNNRVELLDSLHQFIADESEVVPGNPVEVNPKIVFVFPGQGGQWLGMGRQLLQQEVVFRTSIEASDRAFRKYTDWSLLEQLNATEATSRLKEIDVIQPAIFAMQIALAQLWKAWGIVPQAVVGHSMGEVAAAHMAGILTLDDAARIICTRSLLMKTVSGKGGAMAVTELNREQAEEVAVAYPGRLSVAVNNSPKSTVLAGDKDAISEVLADLESKGLFCRLVKVDVASHSPQMDPLKELLRKELQPVVPQKAVVPFVSTVLNKVMDGKDMGADYWVGNLRGMVQFAAVVEQLMDSATPTIFLEANPHPVLVNAINECADFYKKKVTTLASLYRDKPEMEEMIRNLSDFYNRGFAISWPVLMATSDIPKIRIPAYPFQREGFDIEDLSGELQNVKPSAAQFPLLGDPISLAHTSDTYYWESSISLSKFPYLRDHVIHEQVELPVSCHIELVLEAMSELFKEQVPFRLEDLKFSQYLTLTEKSSVAIQVKLMWSEDQTGKVFIFSKQDSKWIALAEGTIVSAVVTAPALKTVFEKIEYHAPAYTEGGSYYHLLRSIGQNYGRHFQQLTGLDRIGIHPFANVLFSIKTDPALQLDSSRYKIHPALLSSFFQPVFVQLTHLLEEGHCFDIRFQNIKQLAPMGQMNYDRELRGLLVFQVLKKQKEQANTWHFSVDITIANHDNTEVMSIKGLEGITHSRPQVKSNRIVKDSAVFSATEAQSETAIEQLIIQHVARIIKSAPQRIKPTMAFKSLGVDSLMAVQLRNALEANCAIKLSVAWFWSYPTIREYALFLWNKLIEGRPEIKGVTAGATVLTKQISEREKNAKTASDWFVIPQPQPEASTRVFCFHDAGGSAALFHEWSQHLGQSYEVIAVELPGRGKRQEEKPCTSVEQIIGQLMPAMSLLLDKPYIVAGHSMGALLSFEVVRAIRKKGLPLPVSMLVSSAPAPGVYNRMEIPYDLNEQELSGIFPHIDEERMSDAEMRQLLITRLRADLLVLNNYLYHKEEKLDIPFVALHGKEDLRIKENEVAKWEGETADGFSFLSRPGGHGFLESDALFMTTLVNEKFIQKNREKLLLR